MNGAALHESAASLSSECPQARTARWTGLAAASVIAVVPALMALATWRNDRSPTLFYLTWITHAELLVSLLAIFGGFDVKASLKDLKKTTALAAIVWLIVVIAAAMNAAGDPRQALIRGGQTVIHGFFALVLWRMFACQWSKLRRQFLIAVAIGAVLFLPVIVSAVYAARLVVPFHWRDVATGVTNIRQIGFYGVTLTGCAVGLLATEASRVRQWLCGLAFVAGIYLSFWSGGRGSAIPIVIVLALVVWSISGAARKRVVVWSLIAICVASPLSEMLKPDGNFGILRILGRTTATEVDGTDYSSGRVKIWIGTLEKVPERLFIGHGEGQFRSEVPASQGIYNHPHNAIIQFLYQWGIVGTLAIAAMLLPAIPLYWKRVGSEPDVGLPAFAVLLGLAGMGLVDGPFFYAYPIMPALVCLTALIAPPGSASAHRKAV